jgi:hypothetical protein
MQAEESVGTVRALKQILQDHRRLFGIMLTEPATKSSCVGETPQKSCGKFPQSKGPGAGQVTYNPFHGNSARFMPCGTP